MEGMGISSFRKWLFWLLTASLFTFGCQEDWSARLGVRSLWRSYAHPFEPYPVAELLDRLSAHPPKLSFAVLGNTDLVSRHLEGRSETTVFDKIMADIRSIRPEPEFIFHLGDIAEEAGDGKAWQEFLEKAAPFTTAPAHGAFHEPGKARCFVLPGERDVADKRTERDFLQHFSHSTRGIPFSFDRDPYHFIALNSERTDDGWLMKYLGFNRQKNRISGDQLAWLEKDLAMNQGKRIMVFLHKPMFSPVFSAQDGYSLDQYPLDREKVLDLLNKYSVEAVFMGHEPVFHWARIGRTYHIITGGGGRRPKAPDRYGGFHHFLYVTMDEDCRTKVYCVDPQEGAIRGEIELRQPVERSIPPA
jgi:hypothetical protein